MALTISGSRIGPWPSGLYTTRGNPLIRSGSGGSVILEGGMIYQCGKCLTGTDYSRTGNRVSFSTSFPTVCLAVVMCEQGSYGWGTGDMDTGNCTVYVPTQIDASGFYWRAVWINRYSAYYQNGLGGGWHAIGY